MIYLQETQSPEISPTIKMVFQMILLTAISLFVLSRLFHYIEQLYAARYHRPFFLNFSLIKNKLTKDQLSILKREFDFYNKLNGKDQDVFRHRMATFINSKSFIGREGLVVNDEIKTLISATAVMLTFGFRNYNLKLIDKIIVFPEAYFSRLSNAYHKGETNPKLKAVVFSWKDFKKGYHIGDDNLNLGIHEFGHVIHLNAFSNGDISSIIFQKGFNQIISYLEKNQVIRQDLISSKYFRAYAYTNHYEFFAVILENFIETPKEFKMKFPELYNHVREMLNFKFAGY